jgi:3-(3-hydroxy-phenyl)propionate hydroxylase
VRRRPKIPADRPGLKHLVVSHRDAPLDGGLRDRSLFDVGDRFRQLMGCPSDTLVLVRPDDHIAAIASMGGASAQDLYRQVVGRVTADANS